MARYSQAETVRVKCSPNRLNGGKGLVLYGAGMNESEDDLLVNIVALEILNSGTTIWRGSWSCY